VTRTQATHYVSYDRATMLRSFRARSPSARDTAADAIEVQWGVSGGFGHFEYALVRRARDLADEAPERHYGERAASCTGFTPRLAVWSMGRD
jgi:hypothetical protein